MPPKRWPARAVVVVLAVLGMVTAICAAAPGAAGASVAPHRPMRPGAPAVLGSGRNLALAPAGLRAAVRRTLGLRAGSAFQQAKLTAADGAAGDEFGYSVAISGSTVVVGAEGSNSVPGAAYVFVHSSKGWSQQAELTPSGGAAGDDFGYSVAISGSTAVVGALGFGAAYVFTQLGKAWSQQAELTPSGGATGAGFGWSVAVAGSTAVVGAPGVDSDDGSAYVYGRSGSTWSQQGELTDPSGTAHFGWSVAISGSTIVVGAWGGTLGEAFGWSVAISASTAVVGALNGNSGDGTAYAFVQSGSAWSQQAELTASGGTAGDEFGTSVAVSGSTVVAGAYATTSDTGSAYVFVQSGSAWSQQAELTASGGTAGDEFGTSMAMSGSTAVVGAPGVDSDTGAAYVFALPSQQAELTASHGTADAFFGFSVAISGSTAVVGAYGKNTLKGAVYVFVRKGSTWKQQAELTASNGISGDQFGQAVAVSGSTVVVGAPYRGSTKKNVSEGAAYVFTRSGSTWSQQAQLAFSGAAANDGIGWSVAISGSMVVVGAPGANTHAGAAYVFTGSGGTWSQQAQLAFSGAAANDGIGWSVAISGSMVVVGAPGANTHAGAAYVFTGSGGTWSQQAELTAADAAGNSQFGLSVALTGSTAIVGAPDREAATGAAYAFVNV